MRYFNRFFTFVFFAAASFAQAQTLADRAFDPLSLSFQDKRYLQAALAFEGAYDGLIDGKWGKGSQGALNKHLGTSGAPRGGDVGRVIRDFQNEYGDEGWNYVTDGTTGLYFLAPIKPLLDIRPSGGITSWRHTQRPLEILLARASALQTSNWHRAVLEQSAVGQKPYTVRKNALWISSVDRGDGGASYARSQVVNGEWSTIILSTNRERDPAFAAIAGSIRPENPGSLVLDPTGYLGKLAFQSREVIQAPAPQSDAGDLLGALLKKLDDFNTDAAPAPKPQDRAKTVQSSIFGSGILVNGKGFVLTGLDTIAGCRSIFVNGREAKLVASNETFGLAALRAPLNPKPGQWAVFAKRPLAPGTDFALAGYSLSSFWEEFQLEKGFVGSREKGGIGTGIDMKLSGSIAPGYSGGPILNKDGHVAAIVTGRTANSGQRINRAIHAEIAKLFLAQNAIGYGINDTNGLEQIDFAARARAFTVPLQCGSN